MRFVKQSLLCGALVAAASTFAAPAMAAVQIDGDTTKEGTQNFSGNPCQGISFANCYASPVGTVAGPGEGRTPAVIKFENGGGFEVSSMFANLIDGTEFDIDLSDSGILTFTYSPDAGDPMLTYFSIKQSNEFALFFEQGGFLGGTEYSFDTGDLFFNKNGNPQPGFSNLVFYDTKGPGGGTGGGGGGAVPEPGTWAMMLLGFGGMGVAMRRRRRSTLAQQMA